MFCYFYLCIQFGQKVFHCFTNCFTAFSILDLNHVSFSFIPSSYSEISFEGLIQSSNLGVGRFLPSGVSTKEPPWQNIQNLDFQMLQKRLFRVTCYSSCIESTLGMYCFRYVLNSSSLFSRFINNVYKVVLLESILRQGQAF